MSTHHALTTLSTEENDFRLAVRDFAEGEIKPLVSKMDDESKMDPEPRPEREMIASRFS